MRRIIALLITAGFLPLVALGGIVATVTLRNQRSATEAQAHAHAQFGATLIAERLATALDEARLVTHSPAFDDGFDISRFRTLAGRIVRDHPDWMAISVADAVGNRLLDVPEPIGGQALGRVVDPASLVKAVATRSNVVGRVIVGPRGNAAFAIRAPVVRDGSPRYVVSVVLPVSYLRKPLLFEPLPPSWRAGIIDGDGYVVASTDPASKRIGHLASLETREARANGIQGLYAFTRPDGVRAAAVFVPIAGTGWSVHVSAPASLFYGPASQAILVIIGATLLCVLLFAVLARLIFAEFAQVRSRERAALQGQRMEALGVLTGGVAHDFNNLLTPIIGGLDLLRRRVGEDQKSLRHVDLAMASAERARTLVGRLLAFSRRQLLAPRDIDFQDLIDQLSELLERSVSPAVTVKLDIAADLPPVHADSAQLDLAILNLAINARDAMTPGGGIITIAATRAAANDTRDLAGGPFVRISVADSGTGMDEATLRHAIEPFFTTKAAEKGTGLGLSMVHGFAAQSGGALRIQSAPGAGTTVALFLPQGITMPKRTASPIVTSGPATSPQRLLLVDDDEAVRASTADILRAEGHEVIEAGGVDQALSLMAAEIVVDAVITDYLMPVKTGADLIQAVRRTWPALPVLLITGYINASNDVPKDVIKIPKPFRADELIGGLTRMLGTRAVGPASA